MTVYIKILTVFSSWWFFIALLLIGGSVGTEIVCNINNCSIDIINNNMKERNFYILVKESNTIKPILFNNIDNYLFKNKEAVLIKDYFNNLKSPEIENYWEYKIVKKDLSKTIIEASYFGNTKITETYNIDNQIITPLKYKETNIGHMFTALFYLMPILILIRFIFKFILKINKEKINKLKN